MTPSVVTAVLLLSALSFVTTFLGVVLALWVRTSDRAVAAGIGFSVGMMLLIALVELLPQAILSISAAPALAVGAVGMALVAIALRLIPHTHLVAENGTGDTAQMRSAYLIVFGLVLHDLPEGFAMANAYIAAPALGVVTAIAIALHNLPEEFAMAVPVVATARKRVLFGAALLSALAEPVGAVIGLVAVCVAPAMNGAFLALAAGAMLYVSVHELMPMARRYHHTPTRNRRQVVSTALTRWSLGSMRNACMELAPDFAQTGLDRRFRCSDTRKSGRSAEPESRS